MAFDSPHYDIIMSVQANILSLENPSLPETSVRVRDGLVYVKAEDTLPLVVIYPSGDMVGDMTFPNKDHMDYSVKVGFIVERNLVHETDIKWLLYWRKRIRNKLRTTSLTHASGVYDVQRYNGNPPFDRSGVDKLHGVSVLEVVYRNVEDRES